MIEIALSKGIDLYKPFSKDTNGVVYIGTLYEGGDIIYPLFASNFKAGCGKGSCADGRGSWNSDFVHFANRAWPESQRYPYVYFQGVYANNPYPELNWFQPKEQKELGEIISELTNSL